MPVVAIDHLDKAGRGAFGSFMKQAKVRSLLAQAAAELAAERRSYAVPPHGIMVEVPAAALALEAFDIDFASIGSNDLLQYTMAAARDNHAVSELAGGPGKAGAVSAFAIEPDGKLTLLNQAATVGAGPCHLTVDRTGRMVIAANYTGGSVVS